MDLEGEVISEGVETDIVVMVEEDFSVDDGDNINVGRFDAK